MTMHFLPGARPRLVLTAAAAALVLTGAAGCGSSAATVSGGSGNPVVIDSSPSSLFDGVVLGNAPAKPALTLTDTTGKPYNLVARTAGKLTLLYFGYTHCPDVCPTTMASIAITVSKLTPVQRAKIAVVFVTTDPNRDTPAVLKAWLGQFNPAFVGLSGPFTTIQRAAAAVGVSIQPPVALPGGGYTVTHGAEVLAFNTDERAHVVFTGGTTVLQFEHDVPLLLAGRDLTAQ